MQPLRRGAKEKAAEETVSWLGVNSSVASELQIASQLDPLNW